MYMRHIEFQDSSIRGFRVSELPSITDRQTDGQMDGETGPNQYALSTSEKLGGIKNKLLLPN